MLLITVLYCVHACRFSDVHIRVLFGVLDPAQRGALTREGFRRLPRVIEVRFVDDSRGTSAECVMPCCRHMPRLPRNVCGCRAHRHVAVLRAGIGAACGRGVYMYGGVFAQSSPMRTCSGRCVKWIHTPSPCTAVRHSSRNSWFQLIFDLLVYLNSVAIVLDFSLVAVNHPSLGHAMATIQLVCLYVAVDAPRGTEV